MMSRRIDQCLIVVLFFLSLPLQAQQAQPAQSAPATAPAPTDPLGRSSPRGTVIGFLTAAHKGDWTTAVQYLDVGKGEDPVELSTQLSVVLDQGLPANLDQLSDKPEGNLNDNLPAARELAGVVPTNGGPLDVTLERVHRGTQIVWLFSPD